MKKMKNIVVFAVAFISFISSHVFAGQDSDNILNQINNSWAIGLSALNIHYKEVLILPAKSTETGTIGGLFLDWRNTFQEKIYTDLYLDLYAGELMYDGAEYKNLYLDQDGNLRGEIGPYKNNRLTHLFANADLKLGYVLAFDKSSSFQVVPYVGTGVHYWHRSINLVDEAHKDNSEEYSHFKAILGVKLDCLLGDNFVLSPYVEGGEIFSSRMELKDTSFKLGNKPIYSAGFELNYKLSHKLFLTGFVNYTHFGYGKSKDHPVPMYIKSVYMTFNVPTLEPSSKTNEVKVGVGFRFS